MLKKLIKNIFIILFLIVFGLNVLSFDQGIIVQESLFIYHWQYIISIILCFIVLLFIINPKGYLSKEIETKNLNPLFVGFSLVFVTFVFLKLFFEEALPLHLHKILEKKNVTKEVIIKNIHIVSTKGELFKRNCKYKTVEIKDFKGEICGINKHIIDNLYEGDKLILEGEESAVGFIPYNIKK